MKRRNLQITASIVLAVLAVLFGVWLGVRPVSAPKPQQSVVQPIMDCSLNPQQFLRQVNGLRAKLGESPLTYDARLQQSAAAHLQDMEQFDYYGHTNPTNKHNGGYFIKEFDPNVNGWGEVETGARPTATLAFQEFVDSPPHYQILTAPWEDYLGVSSIYYAGTLLNYDENGNSLGTVSGHACIVVAELAHDN